MELRPILSTLLRHKTAAILIVMEIALACAIISNALFLVNQRADGMQRPSGIDAEDRILTMLLSGIGTQDNADAQTRTDLESLRAIPGVESATVINQLPFYPRSSNNSGLALAPEQQRNTLNAAQYMASEGFIKTLGLRLIAGRDFNADEYQDASVLSKLEDTSKLRAPAILSKTAADKLFPGQNAVGKTIYIGNIPLTVIGIVQTLTRPNSQRDQDSSFILPLRQNFNGSPYVVRIKDASQAESIRKAISTTLERNSPNRLQLEDKPFTQIHSEFFRNDRAMIGLLLTVCVALLIVTALGIVGLASFWVQQRGKQIGIRRALGATRGQILRYFQTENFILASLGIVLGMLAAYGINQLLMSHYELPRLPLIYLPIGALILWVLGQLAVLGPARKAASIPPAVATRSA